MHDNWPTQKQDLSVASDIINKHLEINAGEPLGFLEVILSKDEDKILEVKTPAWVCELVTYFREQYGHEYGHAITSKVLTKMLLKGEVIH